MYSGAAPVGNPYDGGIAGGSLAVNHAFIQFAGFTMGRTISAFDAPWVNYPGNNFDGLVGGSGINNGVNQFTYTAQFGNGVSATLSAQDPVLYAQAGLLNLSGATAAGMLGGVNGLAPSAVRGLPTSSVHQGRSGLGYGPVLGSRA